jgi:hypothetical protein
MNRFERSFAPSLDRPHARCSLENWRLVDKIDLG